MDKRCGRCFHSGNASRIGIFIFVWCGRISAIKFICKHPMLFEWIFPRGALIIDEFLLIFLLGLQTMFGKRAYTSVDGKTPTGAGTKAPSKKPTTAPVASSSTYGKEPTTEGTLKPTRKPTNSPVSSSFQSTYGKEPSASSTSKPTKSPTTKKPTRAPTNSPYSSSLKSAYGKEPSASSTKKPTKSPSSASSSSMESKNPRRVVH
jgi:hypothetical protein